MMMPDMLRARVRADMSAADKKPPSSIAETLIVWGIAALGFLAVAYFVGMLVVALCNWANDAWWHWPFAIIFLLSAVILPLAFILWAGGHLIAAAGAGARSLWWETVSYLGAVGALLLILWAFTTDPEWWLRGLLWAAVVAAAVGAVFATAEAVARGNLRWATVSRLGVVGVLALILFTTAPGWGLWGLLWCVAFVAAVSMSAVGRIFCAVCEVPERESKKARATYSAEWKFNHGDVNSPPELGIAMSGGGIRSAAFNLGVLHALHENGLLRNVDVMSAVSGGSYAMSWYLLQPFYAADAAEREHKDFRLDDIIDEMFLPNGRFQSYLCGKPCVMDWEDMGRDLVLGMTVSLLGRAMAAALGNSVMYNEMGGGREKYRKRLQTLFQGLPSRSPLPGSQHSIENRIDPRTQTELSQDHRDSTEVKPAKYQELAQFAQQNRLPYFIFNAAVLVQHDHRHELWPTAFELTAHDLGSDVCGYRTWEAVSQQEVTGHERITIRQWMCRPWRSIRQWIEHLQNRGRQWILLVNVAPAISGAALGLSYFNPYANPKQRRRAGLMTWAAFVGNVDLGYLLYRELWNEQGTLYVSDGGHCENLGAYALIKRQCRRIIIVDAEEEARIPYIFDGYSKLKRQLAKEEIQLALTVPDIDAYLAAAEGGSKPAGPGPAVMTGEVKPMSGDGRARPLSVIYIKLGLDRDRLGAYPVDVSSYAEKKENGLFPQDPTRNQSFTREQFMAYRELGRHVARDLDKLAAMSCSPTR